MESSLNYKYSAFAQELLVSIRCGNYTAGMRIMSERDLSDKFAVSRNTVREGLAELFGMGILERRGKGAFVTTDALRIIESGSAQSSAPVRVMIMMEFSMYESPIYRTIFETVRSGLYGRTVCETFFSEVLPGAGAAEIKHDDIVLLFGSSCSEEVLWEIERKAGCMILINRTHNMFNCIVPDNYAAGYAVGEHLFAQGHRRIGAALAHPFLPGEFGDRFRGARDFLQRQGIELMTVDITDYRSEYELNQRFMDHFLAAGATAVICFKDITALMIYEAARCKGIKLPQDLSVIGFDDRCYTANCVPALSTVRYPAEAIGGAALHAVMTALEGKSLDIHQQVPMALLQRESVCDLSKKQ